MKKDDKLNWRRGDHTAVLAATCVSPGRIDLGKGILNVKRGVYFLVDQEYDGVPTPRGICVSIAAHRADCEGTVATLYFQGRVQLHSLSRAGISLKTIAHCEEHESLETIFCAAVAEKAHLRAFVIPSASSPGDIVRVLLSLRGPVTEDEDFLSYPMRPAGIVVAEATTLSLDKVFRFKKTK